MGRMSISNINIPVQTTENTNNYLESLFGENKACPNPIRVPLLTNRVLFKYLLKYGLRPKRFTLITNNPFPVTSKFQNILNRLNRKKIMNANNSLVSDIVVDDYFVNQNPEESLDLFYIVTK